MTETEMMLRWLQGFPGMKRVGQMRMELVTPEGENGGMWPGGMQEIGRRTDVLGNVTVRNRIVFGLRFLLEKPVEDGGTENAQWLIDLQKWVQEQAALGNAPVFGSRTVRIAIGKGGLKAARAQGTGVYTAEIAAEFETEY